MARYIEKEPLCAWLENMGVSDFIIRKIESEANFPTADVAEVVRCKDCSHCAGEVFGGIYCRLHDGNLDKEAYCSYGERKE